MATQTQTPSSVKKAKPNQTEYTWAVGRRKRAIARVRLYLKKDTKANNIDITVNDKPVGQYFHTPSARLSYANPLVLTKTLDRFRVTVRLEGSGVKSQLDAMLHGIARALVKVDDSFKPSLRLAGYLTRDPRKRQKRMIGQGGKARAKKQSPKR